MVRIFLRSACLRDSDELVKNLCDMQKFKKYFNENNKEKWYAVLNTLNGNAAVIKEIIVELAVFRNELSFVLNNVSIDDEEVFSFFKRLSAIIYRLENGDLESSDFDGLMKFMWELFSGWSFINGYKESDIVQEIIDKV